MITWFKEVCFKEKFIPSILGVFINPFYFIRRGLYKGVALNKKYLRGRLLDFGCGSEPYRELCDVQEYIGLDIEKSEHNHRTEQIVIFYDGKTIPFDDGYFDSVLSSEVFEHVPNLHEIINELYRVLKPNGYLLVTVPFVWDEHGAPYDFVRYTSYGINHLLKQAGFEVIAAEKTTNYVETVFQMWNAYIYQFVLPTSTFIRLLTIPLVIAPVTILGIILSRIFPKNKNLYHNNIVVARKPAS
jgi:SAM-dependent methyltransferase